MIKYLFSCYLYDGKLRDGFPIGHCRHVSASAFHRGATVWRERGTEALKCSCHCRHTGSGHWLPNVTFWAARCHSPPHASVTPVIHKRVQAVIAAGERHFIPLPLPFSGSGVDCLFCGWDGEAARFGDPAHLPDRPACLEEEMRSDQE